MLELQSPFPLFDFPTSTMYALVLPSDMVKLENVEPMSSLFPNKVKEKLCALAGDPLTLVMV
jgi:hypothetical protein